MHISCLKTCDTNQSKATRETMVNVGTFGQSTDPKKYDIYDANVAHIDGGRTIIVYL